MNYTPQILTASLREATFSFLTFDKIIFRLDENDIIPFHRAVKCDRRRDDPQRAARQPKRVWSRPICGATIRPADHTIAYAPM